MTPDDCSHPSLELNHLGDAHICPTCGLWVPRRTVAEHIAAMRTAISNAKAGKGKS